MVTFIKSKLIRMVWLLVVVLGVSLVMGSVGFAQTNTVQGKVFVMWTDTNAEGNKYAAIKLVCGKCGFNMGERNVNLPAAFHDEFTCNKCKYYNIFDAQLESK